ncbi:hypothetical protein LPJ61_006843, partial [Coemansia biformis]
MSRPASHGASASTSGTSTPAGGGGSQAVMTFNSRASTNLEAGPSFVNAYYGALAAAGTVSQLNSGQGPAAAAVVASQKGLAISDTAETAGPAHLGDALLRLSEDDDAASRK